MVQLLWKTVWWFLKKLKIELPYDLAIPFLGIYPKESKAGSWRDICTLVFIEVLFTIAKKWKQPKCSSTDKWINKMLYIYTMEYYSALKRKEILTHATTWMNLKDIMLSEISQSQKDRHCMIPLIWVPKVIKFIKTESRMVVAKGRESSYHIITIPIFLTILYSHITYLIFAFSGPKFLCLLYLLILEWEKYSGNEKQSNYSQIYKLLKTRKS